MQNILLALFVWWYLGAARSMVLEYRYVPYWLYFEAELRSTVFRRWAGILEASTHELHVLRVQKL
jgi:hypothetical protein